MFTTTTQTEAERLTDRFRNYSTPRVDEADAVPRPTTVETFYVEQEIDLLGTEQVTLWRAAGVAASRSAEEVIGGLEPAATAIESLIDHTQARVDRADADEKSVHTALSPYIRRPAKAKPLFYAKMAAIFLGDIAGMASASIIFGIEPTLAFIQAVSIGGAAVAAGGAGAEFKDLQVTRKLQRPIEDLDDDLRPYAHYFRGPDSSEPLVKIGMSFALMVVALIFGGVFALQTATDSTIAGLLFGCLAAAVGLASFVNYWTYTDHIADHVERAQARTAHETKALVKLTTSGTRERYGTAVAQRDSIVAEHAARGEAARDHVLSLGRAALANMPGIVGHGVGAAVGEAPAATLVTDTSTLDEELAQLGMEDGR